MIFHCTEKMRKKLHLPPLTQVADETSPHLRWYTNVFTVQRVQYVLTTNADSLLSVVLPGRGLSKCDAYQRAFLESLGTYLAEKELRLVFERIILPGSATVFYSKTSNRSVLGTLNEMAFECAYGMAYQRMDVGDVMRRLNKSLYSAIKYDKPREAFAKLPLQERIP